VRLDSYFSPLDERRFFALYAFSFSRGNAGSILPGGHSKEVTPVPIPNTDVKGLCGDGTATLGCGRVARCRDYFLARQLTLARFFFSAWRHVQARAQGRPVVHDEVGGVDLAAQAAAGM